MASRARMANHVEVGSWPCCEAVVGACERRVLASDALGVVLRARGWVDHDWMCGCCEEVEIDGGLVATTTITTTGIACAGAWVDGWIDGRCSRRSSLLDQKGSCLCAFGCQSPNVTPRPRQLSRCVRDKYVSRASPVHLLHFNITSLPT
jgi:hypothetical protein